MATVPDIPVVHVALRDDAVMEESSFTGSTELWTPVEVPRPRRPTPTTIAILAVVAGIGAMALGAGAVVVAGTSSNDEPATASTPNVTTPSRSEQKALALLAKPSTDRVVFDGSGGRLVLAVGSGGRAAILLRGLARAAEGKPYRAWVSEPGRSPIRAATFVGTERAVFLSVAVGPGASVVVSTNSPSAASSRTRIVAHRG